LLARQPSLDWMATSNVNLDATVQASISDSADVWPVQNYPNVEWSIKEGNGVLRWRMKGTLHGHCAMCTITVHREHEKDDNQKNISTGWGITHPTYKSLSFARLRKASKLCHHIRCLTSSQPT
jgi:hypothetical protein